MLKIVFSVFFVFSFCSYSAMAQSIETDLIDAPAEPNLIGDVLANSELRDRKSVERFYAYRDDDLVWDTSEKVAAFQQAAATSWQDGLQPRDFGTGPEDDAFANFQIGSVEDDLILTDLFLSLLNQLHNGKVDPESLDPDWNFDQPIPAEDWIAAVSDLLDAGEINTLVDRARPSDPYYARLRRLLDEYSQIQNAGGWPEIPGGPVLKPEMSDPRAPLLRARLGQSRPAEADQSQRYDPDLVAAIEAFQTSHGLEADGVIGAKTLAALNISVGDRIDAIRVNLERGRWLARATDNVGDDIVIVNIAGFELRLFLSGEQVWQTPVIVGKNYTRTPVFTDEIEYLEINPTWTVPRSIIRKSILPRSKQDVSYLASNNFSLVDATGGTVDPLSLDWPNMTMSRFPFSVVQGPGPTNALGFVKFIFPNKHSVYLHDTPSRALFDRVGRTFSHGCVRVQDPFDLAEFILEDRNNIDREEIDRILSSEKQTRIILDKPLKVAILYWTVDPVSERIRFFEDVYNRDAPILAALDATR